MASSPGVERGRGLVAEQSVSTMMPAWSSPRPSSALGADHAVGDMAVGLAGRDLEATGQHRAGQHARRRGRRPRSCVRRRRSPGACPRSPAGRARRRRRCTSGSSCRSSAARLDRSSTRPTTSGPVMSPPWSALLLEADAHERGSDVRAGRVRGRGRRSSRSQDSGRAHQISIPNCWENRTSPSTMSCMSATPWRSMSARSMPSPNAKPV